jgi:hypothetical protein
VKSFSCDRIWNQFFLFLFGIFGEIWLNRCLGGPIACVSHLSLGSDSSLRLDEACDLWSSRFRAFRV